MNNNSVAEENTRLRETLQNIHDNANLRKMAGVNWYRRLEKIRNLAYGALQVYSGDIDVPNRADFEE